MDTRKPAKDRWQEAYSKAPERDAEFSTMSGVPIKPLYTPDDVEGDYDEKVGYPGEYPYTRGVYPNMYRGRLWTVRQFAGYGTAAETNVRFRYLTVHTAMLGGGYRNQSPGGFHWGFQVTAGPVFYGGRYQDVVAENRTAGLVEGRVHLGHAVGPVVAGAAVGYAEPFSVSRRSLAGPHVGGLLLGLFMDWR